MTYNFDREKNRNTYKVLMENDNTTPHKAIEYDDNIIKTIPFYENFHNETIDLVFNYNKESRKWLDIGCGTGTFIEKAYNIFPNTKFILSDLSEEMLVQAKQKFKEKSMERVNFIQKCCSQELSKYISNKVDVITAIQVHHYLSKEERIIATRNCYDLLNDDGIYITFENIKPLTDNGTLIGLNRWGAFQENMGRTKQAIENHKSRFNKEYYPISILDHIELLKNTGFNVYEVFWYSHMQCGFYAIKK
ncbi:MULTISPECIES: class I SAM-dependent methyltransferase [unclassified Clostridium]|uniref:class I SAM-dependent methyltransferase n=1 Tax=unclassified Clostridium TaxID=2614128 RepID=UPI0002984498|nr:MULTISPECIES: class I SAM-dependent methyltransferase [unclassified Clostridium]EKQ54443.1 MAG: methylase involved in ubiquinone/menaquinone biosynthesis [Clostridium sp. Maddingley MBC34-26]